MLYVVLCAVGLLSVGFVVACIVAVVRLWPDRAATLFLMRNIRVSRERLAWVRDQLATVVNYEVNESQKAIAQQQLKAQALQLEVSRLQRTANVASVSSLVGQRLQAIERDHLIRLGALSTEQAREALRRTTEKEINDLLLSVNASADGMPEFRFLNRAASAEPDSAAQSQARVSPDHGEEQRRVPAAPQPGTRNVH